MKEHKKLTRLQYFEWTLSIERLEHAKTRAKLSTQEFITQQWKCKAESLQLQKLQQIALQGGVSIEKAKEQYKTDKKQLEKKIGISLSGKIINENLEILSDSDL